MTETKQIANDKFEVFSKEYQAVLKQEHEYLFGGKRDRDQLSALIEQQQRLVHDFVKENDLKLVELNTAWVEKSEPRRTYTYYGKSANDFDVKHYPNISDKEFASKFNKGKGDTLFIKSNFWGPEYMCII